MGAWLPRWAFWLMKENKLTQTRLSMNFTNCMSIFRHTCTLTHPLLTLATALLSQILNVPVYRSHFWLVLTVCSMSDLKQVTRWMIHWILFCLEPEKQAVSLILDSLYGFCASDHVPFSDVQGGMDQNKTKHKRNFLKFPRIVDNCRYCTLLYRGVVSCSFIYLFIKSQAIYTCLAQVAPIRQIWQNIWTWTLQFIQYF